jgi:tRNA pseudouridine13 synthase
MRKSPYSLEQDLGMRFYASNSDGIGGTLRSRAEDFLVEEIPLPDTGGIGPYLLCRLTKKNWEQQHAIKEIAKRLGISYRRISWAGTKDRRAVTKQLISLYNVSPEALENVNLKDISLEVIRQQNTRLSFGDLLGNRFDILIRDVTCPNLPTRLTEISDDIEKGIPNYYGIQRFGGVRPITHRVGEHILTADYEKAVLTYIGLAFPQEAESIRNVRDEFNQTRDPKTALRELPIVMAYERSMLQHLHNHPDDYAGALQSLPTKLLSMFVSAFQSYLFNEGISNRLEKKIPLHLPYPGDRLIFSNGKQDIVTQANARTAEQLIKRRRCGIAIFMPGKEPFVPLSESEHFIVKLMKDRGIGSENFRKASEFVRTKFEGALRPIGLQAPIDVSIEESNVRLRFILPPGHYATTIAREFMKTNPLKMI